MVFLFLTPEEVTRVLVFCSSGVHECILGVSGSVLINAEFVKRPHLKVSGPSSAVLRR